MRYAIRYTPDSDLGRRYPKPTCGGWLRREDAEAAREQCPNADLMEVIEVAA